MAGYAKYVVHDGVRLHTVNLYQRMSGIALLNRLKREKKEERERERGGGGGGRDRQRKQKDRERSFMYFEIR